VIERGGVHEVRCDARYSSRRGLPSGRIGEGHAMVPRLISDMAMLATVIAFFFLSTLGFADNFTGSVVAILDGDTPEVLHNYTPNVSALAH
jgi:hypothetical protein